MKRLAISVISLFILSYTISSCQKCTVCTGTDALTGDDDIEEFCGSKSAVDSYEKNWVDSFSLLGQPAHCQRDPHDWYSN